MRYIVSVALICLATAGLLSMSLQPVKAVTPGPTATPTAAGTPAPVATPTAPAKLAVARFDGSAWVNARLSSDTVIAKIGDTVCGQATPIGIGSGATPYFFLEVASDQAVPGCGKPGDTITFFVGDKQANQTAEWQPSEGSRPLKLVVGPPFAVFAGKITLRTMPVQEEVIPFIADTACGYQLNPWMGEGPTYGYAVVVYSQELKAGCGTDGAEVTFKLINKTSGKVIADAMGSATWHPMASRADVNLAFPETPIVEIPVAGGETGDVGDSGWWAVAIAFALLVVGGGAVMGARALRRD